MGCKRCKEIIELCGYAIGPTRTGKQLDDIKYHLEMLHEYVK